MSLERESARNFRVSLLKTLNTPVFASKVVCRLWLMLKMDLLSSNIFVLVFGILSKCLKLELLVYLVHKYFDEFWNYYGISTNYIIIPTNTMQFWIWLSCVQKVLIKQIMLMTTAIKWLREILIEPFVCKGLNENKTSSIWYNTI